MKNEFIRFVFFFNETLFQGNRTRKRSAVDFSGFESPKANVLARVGTSIQISKTTDSTAQRRKTGKFPPLKPQFSDRVAMVHLTPGFPSFAFKRLLSQLDGLILVAFPSGTAPTHSSEFLGLLKEARRIQLPVIVATEGIGVTGSEYQAGREMLDNGCLWSGAMTPECAYVKAALLLGQSKGRDFLRKWWSTEFAGEGVSQRSLA